MRRRGPEKYDLQDADAEGIESIVGVFFGNAENDVPLSIWDEICQQLETEDHNIIQLAQLLQDANQKSEEALNDAYKTAVLKLSSQGQKNNRFGDCQMELVGNPGTTFKLAQF